MFLFLTTLTLSKGLTIGNKDKNAPQANFEPYSERYEVIYEGKQQLIERLSKQYNFNVNIAKKIAECESQFGLYNNNWEGSSAKGIYQFTDKTWNNYCAGDVLDDYDNIRCFIKLYEKHKSWWKCKA